MDSQPLDKLTDCVRYANSDAILGTKFARHRTGVGACNIGCLTWCLSPLRTDSSTLTNSDLCIERAEFNAEVTGIEFPCNTAAPFVDVEPISTVN